MATGLARVSAVFSQAWVRYGRPTLRVVGPVSAWTLPAGYAYDPAADLVVSAGGGILYEPQAYWPQIEVPLVPAEPTPDTRMLIAAGMIPAGGIDVYVLAEHAAALRAAYAVELDGEWYVVKAIERGAAGVGGGQWARATLARRGNPYPQPAGPPPEPEPGPELLPDGSFEVGLASWTVYMSPPGAAVVARSSAYAADGACSLRVEFGPTDLLKQVVIESAVNIACTPGDVFRLTGQRFEVVEGASIAALLWFGGEDGGSVGSIIEELPPAPAGWAPFELVSTAPPEAAVARCGLIVTAAQLYPVQPRVYIDALSLRRLEV